MRIPKEYLPELLGKIGETLGKGKDLILEQHEGCLYTRIGEEGTLTPLGPGIRVNQEEIMEFSEEEIQDMEDIFYCQDSEEEVDRYYCKNLCPNRRECEKI